jgi:dolichol-phosphate mannosyltransferase
MGCMSDPIEHQGPPRPARDAATKPKAALLSVVAPTFCERENIQPLVDAVSRALGDQPFELIFVDDDSPDGTYEEIVNLARSGAPVRCIRRVGRRGLASAVVEGVMSSSGELVAVIDADLQHDERLLPRMAKILNETDADIVIASRAVEGGGLGDLDPRRRRMSALATWVSRLLIGNEISDPMSGFFMTRRQVFDGAIYDLTQQGYKILLDVLTSSPRPLKVVELPYVFRRRHAGESKVDAMILAEFAFLIIEKLTRGLVPPRFVLFASVGAAGLSVHLAVLQAMRYAGAAFLSSQATATLCAMTFNFLVNNLITYRTDRLRGPRLLIGYVIFCAVCSFGALANVSVANLTMTQIHSWPVAGIAGALMSAVFNFGVTTRFVWGRAKPGRDRLAVAKRGA